MTKITPFGKTCTFSLLILIFFSSPILTCSVDASFDIPVEESEESTILTADRIFDEITVDGRTSESSWANAKRLTITIQDGTIGQISVELKALYDNENFYLYSSWPDRTENVDKMSWSYDAKTGTWSQSEDEDRIAILWNIDNSINGFNIGGCAMTCHGDRKSTNAPGEMGDMWHWHAGITNPVGFCDDTFLDDEAFSSLAGWTAIRGDEQEVDNVIQNFASGTSHPLFMQDPEQNSSLNPGYLMIGQEVEFNETYKDPSKKIPWADSDTVAGFLIKRPSGSRGDIQAKGIWEDGRWNVEFCRKLVTGNADDVEFDITNIYRFGVAVMDNTGGFRRFGEGHSFDLGARTLEFGGKGSEIITSLSLIRDYLLGAKGYLSEDNDALAKSEITNAYAIFETIENEVVKKDPQRYLDTKSAFEHARSHTTNSEIDELIKEVDELILLFQGKVEPTEPSWEANFMAAWTQIETYVFIVLAFMAIYLLYLIFRMVRKREWRRMSIFLLIITIPIFLEGTGRMGVVANISIFYNLSFMTNEYAKLLWGILMFCAIVFSTLGFRDLTNNIQSLKKSQEEIKYLNAFNENVLNTVPIGIIVVEKQGKISYDNQMFKKLGLLFKADIKDNSLFNINRSNNNTELFDKYRRAIDNGERFEIMKHPIKVGKGRTVYLNIKGEPLKNIDGVIDGVLIVMEDMTDRIKLEEQLYHSEKLASIGQLAAGVAHELNTPLMNISLVAENIQTLTKDESVLENVDTISNQVFNAAKIVDDLLLFSRKRTAEFVDVEINEIINNTLLQLAEKKPANIKINKKFEGDLPIIQGDSNLLERAFIIIIENAFDAMPDGGVLTFTTSKSDNEVVIKISDTGIGIPDEDLKKIFNPFYTTKGPGSGTGLGLAICHGIINEQNGKIEVESTVGVGTIFNIRLPR